jgi:hypothetical protein
MNALGSDSRNFRARNATSHPGSLHGEHTTGTWQVDSEKAFVAMFTVEPPFFLYVDVISTLAQQRFELPGACAL